MTITQAERDWLNALWAQAERDAAFEWFGQTRPFPIKPVGRKP